MSCPETCPEKKGSANEVLCRVQGLQPEKNKNSKVASRIEKTYFLRGQNGNSKSAAKEFAETRKDVLTAKRHLKSLKGQNG